MSLKIEAENITFKIMQKALDCLALGECITVKAPAGSGYIINPVKDSDNAHLSVNEFGFFTLDVPFSSLKKLKNMGKSKEGICFPVLGGMASLQVDVRSIDRSKRVN